ncbi:MAG: formylglycine-generating enzyme family protein [Symploca sp. SIO1B1]|nr:formylglycine-generating enzyme family protein [Symploca sp. SIO1B1]
MKPNPANRRIASFEKRFGKPHLYLAYHAAFPLALTADLLYHLWINFQQDIHGRLLDIPWVAVADILLSPLCEEVGRELYEMDGKVRQELLKQLQADANFSQHRVLQLSDFLLEYVQPQLYSDNPDIQDFAQAQQWTALAYKQPKDAARKLALAYAQLNHQDITELVRLELVVETLAEPLREFRELQIYAHAMAHFARGSLTEATAQLEKISKTSNQIQVAGVSLPIPEEIQTTQPVTKQRLLKAPNLSKLEYFDFEVVMVNAIGEVTKTQRHQAQFFTQELGNEVTLEMVAIPSGTFLMGAPISEKGSHNDECPQHQVTVQPFFMSKYPITQAQWQAVATLPRVNRSLDNNPSRFKGDNLPVESVSWYDSDEFCTRLSQQTGIAYRLPSEAEWEYACRAGTTTPFYFGKTITSELADYDASVSYAYEPRGTYRQRTNPVGEFPPNAFGLRDLHGNVWEWCADPWRENCNDPPSDDSIWPNKNENNHRSWLLRGGSWSSVPQVCRCAFRLRLKQDNGNYFIGFRVVCS